MLDPRDYIDSDEGYRDTDWDSHLNVPEPFFAEALPCESCGKPVDCDRRPAPWDTDLQVGPCCYELYDVPDVPVCPEMERVVMHCATVGEVRDAMEAHRLCCEV